MGQNPFHMVLPLMPYHTKGFVRQRISIYRFTDLSIWWFIDENQAEVMIFLTSFLQIGRYYAPKKFQWKNILKSNWRIERKKFISRRLSQIEKTQMGAEFPFLTSNFPFLFNSQLSIVNYQLASRQRGVMIFLSYCWLVLGMNMWCSAFQAGSRCWSTPQNEFCGYENSAFQAKNIIKDKNPSQLWPSIHRPTFA